MRRRFSRTEEKVVKMSCRLSRAESFIDDIYRILLARRQRSSNIKKPYRITSIRLSLKRSEKFLTARQQAKLARDLLLLPGELLDIGISVRGCLHKSQ